MISLLKAGSIRSSAAISDRIQSQIEIEASTLAPQLGQYAGMGKALDDLATAYVASALSGRGLIPADAQPFGRPQPVAPLFAQRADDRFPLHL